MDLGAVKEKTRREHGSLVHSSVFSGGTEVKNLPARQGPRAWSLCQEDSLEKEMATHSSVLAWKFHGQRSLVGCSPWGRRRVRHNLVIKRHPGVYSPYLCPEIRSKQISNAFLKARGRGGEENGVETSLPNNVCSGKRANMNLIFDPLLFFPFLTNQRPTSLFLL